MLCIDVQMYTINEFKILRILHISFEKNHKIKYNQQNSTDNNNGQTQQITKAYKI